MEIFDDASVGRDKHMTTRKIVHLIIAAVSIFTFKYFGLSNFVSAEASGIYRIIVGALNIPPDVPTNISINRCLEVDRNELDTIDINFDVSLSLNYADRLQLQTYDFCLKRFGKTTLYPEMKRRYLELANILLRNHFNPHFYGEPHGIIYSQKFNPFFYLEGLYPFATTQDVQRVDHTTLCKSLNLKSVHSLLYSCLFLNPNNKQECHQYKNKSELLELVANSQYCGSQ